MSTRTTPHQILFVHGWRGHRKSFADLPRLLEAAGHRVLPIFEQYDSRTPGRTIESIADELEAAWQSVRAGVDGPVTVFAHSMGGLVTRSWLLRHYASQRKSAPVARVIESCSPRHGVYLAAFARAGLRTGLIPGHGLARQMQCPHPFTWNLAWGEFEAGETWPDTAALAGRIPDRTILSWFVGGRDSDGVVPAIFSNPNPLFARLGQTARRPPRRPFRVFDGYAHHRPVGVVSHIRQNPDGSWREPDSAIAAALADLADSTRPAGEALVERGAPLQNLTGFALIFARADTGQGVPRLRLNGRAVRPTQTHPSGLSFWKIELEGPEPTTLAAVFSAGDETRDAADLDLPAHIEPGEVWYVDLRKSVDNSAG